MPNVLARVTRRFTKRPRGVTIGRHTYGHDRMTFQVFIPGARIEVGAFCSIAAEVRILAGSDHMMSRPTTFPLNARIFDRRGGTRGEAMDKGPTIIGNDVWIGWGATILSGVLVGDGAIVGAGAVVSKSVPAYAVVAGNPARIIRYRFDTGTRARLLALRWWDWADEEILAARQLFATDVSEFLAKMEEVHEKRPESDLMRLLREEPTTQLTPHRIEETG
jgi:acetyltransferase-like isoleucine patch superfamily enzyme